MPTATELIVRQQLDDLLAIARDQPGWNVVEEDSTTFRIGLPAKGGLVFWVRCEADRFPTLPPAWRWCDESGTAHDLDHLTPASGESAFLHSRGVICAPWNRLAYESEDARGPHGDWVVTGDWTKNSHTGQCRTLAAMATRIAIELRCRCTGRKAEQPRAA
jgi:hypothetical protein